MKTVIAISGPTGVGKTETAIRLASKFRTEIISCDSRQFYKEMSIGVARPSYQELASCVHHFIGCISIHDRYTAGQFSQEARLKIADLMQVHDTVVVVGGSMLHMDALLYGIDDLPGDVDIKNLLQQELESNGLAHLLQELEEKDPNYFANVDKQNARRIMRALEVIRITQQPFSSLRTGSTEQLPYNIIHVFLNGSREWVYDRINQRVHLMMSLGLLDEVKTLLPYKDLQALNTVGYKEVFEFLEGKISEEECVVQIQQHSRQYAKRQMTWYRNKSHVKEIDVQKEDPISVIQFLIS